MWFYRAVYRAGFSHTVLLVPEYDIIIEKSKQLVTSILHKKTVRCYM